jgi:outer membrane protein assembly factor BamE (lipoprotein component of BamABCDE complex)
MRPPVRGLRLLGIGGILLLAACTTQFRNHGYVPTEAEMARVGIGDTKAELETVIGRPSTRALLQDDRWFYVRSRYRDYALRPPAEIDREVVVISFADDAVTNVERYGLRNGRVVPLSRRVTSPTTVGVPLLEQLFGNIGRFNPGQFLDADDQGG